MQSWQILCTEGCQFACGHQGAACGQLALTSTTAAQKIYEQSGAPGSRSGKTAGEEPVAAVRDIEDLGQQKSEKPKYPANRAVAQPGGDAAVDRWRKRDVSTKGQQERAPVAKWTGLDETVKFSSSTTACSVARTTAPPPQEEPEDDDSRPAPAWTPPDGFLNQAEVRQLIQQLSASAGCEGLVELSKEQLRNAMIEMEPEGEGVRVGVASFATWWEQQQQRQHQQHIVGGCWIAGWDYGKVCAVVVGVSVALACVAVGISRTRGPPATRA
eukprot:COSAG02_NODE_8448_length_2568_cov_1.404212_2_plen_271_part_00